MTTTITSDLTRIVPLATCGPYCNKPLFILVYPSYPNPCWGCLWNAVTTGELVLTDADIDAIIKLREQEITA